MTSRREAYRFWPADEIALLRDPHKTVETIADLTGRTVPAVNLARRRYLTSHATAAARSRWTPAELAIARDRSLSIAEAAARTGRTEDSVRNARFRYADPR